GIIGGNEAAFPACAAFKKNVKFFLHCLGNFTGQPELGIEQNREAVERALLHLNQLTADRLVSPQIDKVFPFEEAVAAHQYMESGEARGRVVLQGERGSAGCLSSPARNFSAGHPVLRRQVIHLTEDSAWPTRSRLCPRNSNRSPARKTR